VRGSIWLGEGAEPASERAQAGHSVRGGGLSGGVQERSRSQGAQGESGSGMFIPDPNFFHPGSELSPSRIRIKEFKYFNPKKWFLSSKNMIRVVHPGSRIWTDFQPITDPGVKKAPDPGSVSAILYFTGSS
jgi:hypothetical protein